MFNPSKKIGVCAVIAIAIITASSFARSRVASSAPDMAEPPQEQAGPSSGSTAAPHLPGDLGDGVKSYVSLQYSKVLIDPADGRKVRTLGARVQFRGLTSPGNARMVLGEIQTLEYCDVETNDPFSFEIFGIDPFLGFPESEVASEEVTHGYKVTVSLPGGATWGTVNQKEIVVLVTRTE